MKKIWFIVKNDEHIGPYSQYDLKDFHRESKISKETKIWKKGLAKAIVYSEINLHNQPEKINKKFKTKEQEAVRKLEEGLRVLQHQEPFKLPGQEDAPFPWNKIAIAFALTLFLSTTPFLYELYQMTSHKISKPSGMKKSDYERLLQTSSNALEEVTVSFAPSKDMSELWMATNFAYDGKVIVKIKSIQEKMLRPEIIAITTEGELKDRLVSFTNLKYEVGTRLVPGYYQFSVEFVSPVEKKYLIENFISLQKKLSQSTVGLISVLPDQVFDQKLAEYQSQRQEVGKQIWFELHQKFLTVKTVVEQIKEEIFMVYDKQNSDSSWQENLQNFEQKYQKYFSVFLTSFSEQDYTTLYGFSQITDEERSSVKDYYQELVQISIKAAKDSARTLSELQKNGRSPSSQDWEWIKSKISKRFDKLIQRSDDGIVIVKSKFN